MSESCSEVKPIVRWGSSARPRVGLGNYPFGGCPRQIGSLSSMCAKIVHHVSCRESRNCFVAPKAGCRRSLHHKWDGCVAVRDIFAVRTGLYFARISFDFRLPDAVWRGLLLFDRIRIAHENRPRPQRSHYHDPRELCGSCSRRPGRVFDRCADFWKTPPGNSSAKIIASASR